MLTGLCRHGMETLGNTFNPSWTSSLADKGKWDLGTQGFDSTESFLQYLILLCESQKILLLMTSQEAHVLWQQVGTRRVPQLVTKV